MLLPQDALDSVEFVSGPADSKWGSMRAAMGHADPWALNYLAIGNEVGVVQVVPCPCKTVRHMLRSAECMVA
jgi:alpha-L-arabinofuranosidase